MNDIVLLYSELNMKLTEDIIERLLIMDDITNTTRQELRVLLSTNGAEVFQQALNESAGISKERKDAINKVYQEVIKEDMKDYKKLFNYRDMPFILSKSQMQMLKAAARQTDKELKNLSQTVAFQTKQAYVDAVDKAYMEVLSGAFDYNTAINRAVKEVAEQGITLKDKRGRNVQLETAVRRNVMTGITHTIHKINEDIEEELGCDGKEVSAHYGSRPTHAIHQGKQYAFTRSDAKKFGVGYGGDVKDIWEEANCRHDVNGIILGVSEPRYSSKELREMKDATVQLNGKEIPLYEATQKQRALENQIRKLKKEANVLGSQGIDNQDTRAKIRITTKKLNQFCDETGLDRKYNREKIAN